MSLLGLPRELRDIIYEYALPDEVQIDISFYRHKYDATKRKSSVRSQRFPLLLVSRQVSNETLCTFARAVNVTFCSIPTMVYFARKHHNSLFPSLRRITLKLNYGEVMMLSHVHENDYKLREPKRYYWGLDGQLHPISDNVDFSVERKEFTNILIHLEVRRLSFDVHLRLTDIFWALAGPDFESSFWQFYDELAMKMSEENVFIRLTRYDLPTVCLDSSVAKFREGYPSK